MTPDEQWKEVGRIFNAVLVLQPEERSSFLDQACGQDEELRREVESLLSLEGEAGGFLSAPALEDAAKLLVREPRFSAGERLGSYEVLEFVESGGMGEIYKARHVTLGNTVALKFLPTALAQDANRLRRLKQEARAASALNHPNIVTVHDFVEADHSHFIVSEYVEGETLRRRLSRGRMDLADVIDVTTQIANGLAAAHTVGVIHRDIKPENIMLRPDGYVKVLDFGLAKLNEETINHESLPPGARLKTDTGIVIGTCQYMSPEHTRGLPVDARTDVWSLGVVLYEMITGHAPFEGKTNSDVIVSILEREPASLASLSPKVPAELQRIIGKALRKEREERYQLIKDMLLDLKTLRVEQESAPLSGKIRRHKTALAMILAGLILTTAAVVYFSYWKNQRRGSNLQLSQRSLLRLTFDLGLQSEPTWSPDGRFIAYSSDKSENFDIWVQPVGGGDAAQVTHSPAHDWQPDWSPDGSQIVFRSERDGGGLYTVPVLGGHEQKISSFGVRPRWSPDGSQILFTDMWQGFKAKLYVVRPGGGEPREVLADFTRGAEGEPGLAYGFAWHPDGQRISILRGDGFWTVPLQGGPPVKSEMIWEAGDVDMAGEFSWSPAGDALYFQGSSREVKNLWKVAVDPQSLRWRGKPASLTTGVGPDTDIALSRNGKRLAYTTRVEEVRIWSLPFDARADKLAGEGQPVTAAGIIPLDLDLTRDGQKLLFIASRTGTQKKELWEKSLADSRERLLTVKDYDFFHPRWSRDGTRVAYLLPTLILPDLKVDPATIILPVDGGDEQKLTSGKGRNGLGDGLPFDWSADGRWVLAGSDGGKPGQNALVLLPVSAAPTAEAEARVVVSDSERMLFEGRFSPDERWICFNAVGRGGSTLYVVPASGGKWVRITEENGWADRPRWSPDGRAIYFVSRRGSGFLNVWRVRFDSLKGEPLGEPVQVTSYESPAKGIREMSLGADRLVLSIMEVTGSIWVLDGVDR